MNTQIIYKISDKIKRKKKNKMIYIWDTQVRNEL